MQWGWGGGCFGKKNEFSKNYFTWENMDAMIEIGGISRTVGGLIGNESRKGSVTAYNGDMDIHFFGKIEARVILTIRDTMEGKIDGMFIRFIHDDSWEN